METAIQVFLTTMAVVFGILAPVIVVLFLAFITFVAKGVGPSLLIKAEELKKAPPFDDVEVNMNPETKIVTARFIKNDSVIWQGDASRRAE